MTDKGKPIATRNGLKVYKTLKSRTQMKASTGLKKTSPKTARRNKNWREIVLARADYLIKTYGRLVCEYSGETIRVLSSVPNDLDEGWGHHIDGNRNHCDESNAFLCKYKYHSLIHDNNLVVYQEMFAKGQDYVTF